jgi:hypothetical protein
MGGAPATTGAGGGDEPDRTEESREGRGDTGTPPARESTVKTSVIQRIWGASGARLLVGDALVLCLLGAGIGAASLPRAARGNPARAEVVVSGEKALTLDLSRDGVHDVPGAIGVTRIEVRGGKVRVLSSPCPRQVCRHGGWIGEPGTLLVCLPNEIVIRVPGEPPGDLGAVTR